jgi:alpha-glucosidase
VGDAFAFYRDLGIDAVKTGYVGARVSSSEERQWHHGQYMVRHYRKVVERAAEYRIMLDVHEPIKDTGIRRTYPNMMTREGARGQEYDAWAADGGNPPEHATILSFTRMMAGPFDMTPGTFDLLFNEARENNRVNTTLAKQLALFVVIHSPLQMASDLIENYTDQPAFQFVRDVPADWSETRGLASKIGDYVTMARKDRNSEDWYLGSITDENPRTLRVQLDFLEPEQDYVAEVYADGENADWESNPYPVQISQWLVDQSTELEMRLAAGGGQAVRFSPASSAEGELIDRYRSPLRIDPPSAPNRRPCG